MRTALKLPHLSKNNLELTEIKSTLEAIADDMVKLQEEKAKAMAKMVQFNTLGKRNVNVWTTGINDHYGRKIKSKLGLANDSLEIIGERKITNMEDNPNGDFLAELVRRRATDVKRMLEIMKFQIDLEVLIDVDEKWLESNIVNFDCLCKLCTT